MRPPAEARGADSGSRAKSNSAGAAKTLSSWLAAAIERKTVSRAASSQPARTWAAVTFRTMVRARADRAHELVDGGLPALGMRAQLLRQRRALEQDGERVVDQVGGGFVSAEQSRVQAPTSSIVFSWPASLCTRAESRLPEGAACSRSISRVKKATNCWVARTSGASTSVPGVSEKTMAARSSDQSWKRARLGIRAQHGGDHQRRDRPRERLVQLDGLALEGGEGALDRLAHVLLERGDRARREGGAHRLSQTLVRRVVPEDHPAGEQLRDDGEGGQCLAAARPKISVRSAESRSTSREPAAFSACESTTQPRWRSLHCTAPARSRAARK